MREVVLLFSGTKMKVGFGGIWDSEGGSSVLRTKNESGFR